MSTPVVTVVCVVYHPGAELHRFVETLAGASARPVELVVVDNGDDQSVSGPATASGGGHLVVTGANLGYGRAANLGAAGSRSPWLVVVNCDIEWSPGSLDALLDAGERLPRAGALGPQVRNVDGSVYPSARDLPSLSHGAGHALFARIWPGNPWTRAYQRSAEDTSTERTAGWLSGSCLLLRRAAFEEVHGFDERYFMFFEDVDLGDRLARSGWSNVFVPTSVVTHVGGTSWRTSPAPMIRAHHDSARRYLSGRYPQWYAAPVRLALAVGLGVRSWLQVRAVSRAAR